MVTHLNWIKLNMIIIIFDNSQTNWCNSDNQGFQALSLSKMYLHRFTWIFKIPFSLQNWAVLKIRFDKLLICKVETEFELLPDVWSFPDFPSKFFLHLRNKISWSLPPIRRLEASFHPGIGGTKSRGQVNPSSSRKKVYLK